MDDVQQRMCYLELRFTATFGKPLYTVQTLVTCRGVLGFKYGRGEHQPHQRTGSSHDIRPVRITNRAQCGDGIAHAQIISGLISWTLHLDGRRIG